MMVNILSLGRGGERLVGSVKNTQHNVAFGTLIVPWSGVRQNPNEEQIRKTLFPGRTDQRSIHRLGSANVDLMVTYAHSVDLSHPDSFLQVRSASTTNGHATKAVKDQLQVARYLMERGVPFLFHPNQTGSYMGNLSDTFSFSQTPIQT